MTVWTLNGRFNFVDPGDVVEIVPAEKTWHATRKGKPDIRGRRGDIMTMILSPEPGATSWVIDPAGVRSTYCTKYPPEAVEVATNRGKLIHA